MAVQLQLHEQQIMDLVAVRQFGAEKLRLAVEYLDQLEKPPLLPNELLMVLNQALAGEEDEAKRLLRPTMWLFGLMRQASLTVEETVKSLSEALARDAKWSEEEIKQWQSVVSQIERLLKTRPVRMVGKALELAYEYANLLRRARIVTDIRPLYSEDAATVEGAVVSFTLRLRFDSADGDHELSIAMDEADVNAIKLQCERALRKARTACCLMQDRGISTVVTGEDTNA